MLIHFVIKFDYETNEYKYDEELKGGAGKPDWRKTSGDANFCFVFVLNFNVEYVL